MRNILMVLIILFLLSGCEKNKEQVKVEPQQNIVNHNNSNNRYEENENAKIIAKKILKDPHVRKVVVVLKDEMALIGLDVKEGHNKNKKYFKQMVIEKTQEVDKNISTIQVSTDKDMYTRISKLNDDIINERPLSGIFQDFMEMIEPTEKK